MKHILDTNNMKKTGYRIGMEEGRKEEKRAKKKIVKEMLKDGEKIMKYSGLQKEEIEELEIEVKAQVDSSQLT